MPPTGSAYNIDWVISIRSNAHVAKDLAWFTSYTPFSSTAQWGALGQTQAVVGVGTVQLTLEHGPHRRKSAGTTTITLHPVLHIPSSVCNLVSGPRLLRKYEFGRDIIQGPGPLLDRKTGEVRGYLVAPRALRLRLEGQNPKQSSLRRSDPWIIAFWWEGPEMVRWREFLVEHPEERAKHGGHGMGDDEADAYVEQEERFKREYSKYRDPDLFDGDGVVYRDYEELGE